MLLFVLLALTPDERQAIYSFLGVAASVSASVVVGRMSQRAATRRGDQETDLGGARLAVTMVRRLDRQVRALIQHNERVENEWWPKHREQDQAFRAEFLKLDPSVKFPPEVPMPRYIPPPPDPEEPQVA